MTFRVMTFNIRNGLADDGANSWEFRRELTAQVIRESNADIIGLQEVYEFQLSYLLSELPDYQCYSVGREDGTSQGEHCSILWRKGLFHRVQAGTFWLSDTPEVPNSMSWGNRITRICSWVEFAEGFQFYNTHWDHESSESRVRSAGLISGVLPSTPWILVGDFNANPSSPELLSLANSNGTKFVTIANGIGTFHDFHGGIDGDCIDHIWTSQDVAVAEFKVSIERTDGQFSSDHYSVVCDLTI
jgi:endonuclease/exonuclease/phosphatase family metal-dependent hydrolase